MKLLLIRYGQPKAEAISQRQPTSPCHQKNEWKPDSQRHQSFSFFFLGGRALGRHFVFPHGKAANRKQKDVRRQGMIWNFIKKKHDRPYRPGPWGNRVRKMMKWKEKPHASAQIASLFSFLFYFPVLVFLGPAEGTSHSKNHNGQIFFSFCAFFFSKGKRKAEKRRLALCD